MLFFNLTASSVKNARNTIPCHELPIYRLLFVMLFLAVPAAVPNIVFFLLFRPVCQTVLSSFWNHSTRCCPLVVPASMLQVFVLRVVSPHFCICCIWDTRQMYSPEHKLRRFGNFRIDWSFYSNLSS